MDPYWMYKVGKDGEVMSKLFTTKKEPKGWYDNPKKAKAGEVEEVVEAEEVVEEVIETVEEVAEETQEETTNGDSTGFNFLGS